MQAAAIAGASAQVGLAAILLPGAPVRHETVAPSFFVAAGFMAAAFLQAEEAARFTSP